MRPATIAEYLRAPVGATSRAARTWCGSTRRRSPAPHTSAAPTSTSSPTSFARPASTRAGRIPPATTWWSIAVRWRRWAGKACRYSSRSAREQRKGIARALCSARVLRRSARLLVLGELSRNHVLARGNRSGQRERAVQRNEPRHVSAGAPFDPVLRNATRAGRAPRAGCPVAETNRLCVAEECAEAFGPPALAPTMLLTSAKRSSRFW